MVQSDASGVDGFGFFYGTIDDDNPSFVSRSFPATQSRRSSHALELAALASFLQFDATPNCLLVWVTDSSAGVWSVNKGRCHVEEDLLQILTIADDRRIQLLALLVPREINQSADYLSHLSYMLNREEVRPTQWRSHCISCP